MVEKTMKDAVDMEDFDRWDKGLPPRKKIQPKIPEPKLPDVENPFPKINFSNVVEIFECKKKPARNPDGMVFIGYSVSLKVKDDKDKEPVVKSGWMPESDYLAFRKIIFREGKVKTDNMEF